MAYSSFEDLEVWKRSCRLDVRIYEVLKDCRDFGLMDHKTRAAVSIASNIAEGAERDSVSEFIRFLHIAKGSAAELRTQVYIKLKTIRLKYIEARFEVVPQSLIKRIDGIEELSLLKILLKKSAVVDSLEQFKEVLGKLME